jgi:RND family efflux transporter MFP subunit
MRIVANTFLYMSCSCWYWTLSPQFYKEVCKTKFLLFSISYSSYLQFLPIMLPSVFIRSGLLLATVFMCSKCLAAEFDCLIEPTQMVEVGSSVTGRIDRVYVKRGDWVKKMQTLATLESDAEQAASELAKFKSQQVGPTQMAESKMEFSKKKLNRRQEMASQKLMALQDSEDTEAEFRLSEAELQVAKENRQIAKLELQQQNSLLNLRTIKSPVEGVVVDQGAFQGEVFELGSNKKYIFKVAEMNPLRVHVILPKNVFGELKHGMNANVTPEIPQGSIYTAKVNMVDRLIDAASGTFVVFLEMPNPKLEIPAGVKCKVIFPELGKK